MGKEYNKMKTPIQELVEIFEEMNTGFEPTIDVQFAISIIKTIQRKEKEFIEDVFLDGLEEEYQFHVNGEKQIQSYDYYNKKFK